MNKSNKKTFLSILALSTITLTSCGNGFEFKWPDWSNKGDKTSEVTPSEGTPSEDETTPVELGRHVFRAIGQANKKTVKVNVTPLDADVDLNWISSISEVVVTKIDKLTAEVYVTATFINDATITVTDSYSGLTATGTVSSVELIKPQEGSQNYYGTAGAHIWPGSAPMESSSSLTVLRPSLTKMIGSNKTYFVTGNGGAGHELTNVPSSLYKGKIRTYSKGNYKHDVKVLAEDKTTVLSEAKGGINANTTNVNFVDVDYELNSSYVYVVTYVSEAFLDRYPTLAVNYTNTIDRVLSVLILRKQLTSMTISDDLTFTQ